MKSVFAERAAAIKGTGERPRGLPSVSLVPSLLVTTTTAAQIPLKSL
jgi:hypothetical protein